MVSLWIKSFKNQLAAILLTTCNGLVRLVVNKLSQAMRTHLDIGLLIKSLSQDVNKVLEFVRFMLCICNIFSETKTSPFVLKISEQRNVFGKS